MAPTFPQFHPARLRSYVFRLPLFTRVITLFIGVFWVLELQTAWDVVQWGALVPAKVNLGTSKNQGPPTGKTNPEALTGRNRSVSTKYIPSNP